jgi:hypothetical protein
VWRWRGKGKRIPWGNKENKKVASNTVGDCWHKKVEGTVNWGIFLFMCCKPKGLGIRINLKEF